MSGVLLDVGLERKTVFFKLWFRLLMVHLATSSLDASFFAFNHTTKLGAIQAKLASTTVDTGASCTNLAPLSFLSCRDLKGALHAYTPLNLLYSLRIGVLVSVVNEDGGGLMALAAYVIQHGICCNHEMCTCMLLDNQYLSCIS